MSAPLVVTGAGGRVGQLLRAAWAEAPPEGLRVLWSTRTGGELPWNIGAEPSPALPQGAIVLHLAGTTRGPLVDDAAALALTICEAVRNAQVRHVFLASTAAVYAPGAGVHAETDVPQPSAPYGRAKLRMEAAVLAWQAATDGAPPVTLLRIGNVAGADALFAAISRGTPVTLDPVAGQPDGPVRSFIGPQALWRVVMALARIAGNSGTVPGILNVAQDPALGMADILRAAGADWRFVPQGGPVLPRAVLETSLLRALVPMPAVTATSLVADWHGTRRVSA